MSRIHLVGGPGGVGKTTLAACLGIQLAKQGHRTLILTVDPARRLAQALGLGSIGNEKQSVPLEGAAHLEASMLDTQHYFDKVIERFATSTEQRDKILNHKIYRTMVESLGGTHEYAAMERLLEFAKDENYDRLVVDTPPSQNAIDFLSAPKRLADFMDNSVLKWFQSKQPIGFKLFASGTKLAMTMFEKIFGAEFLRSFRSLMDDLDGMQQGFRNRHLEIIELLKGNQTSFYLVTRPTQNRYEEAIKFMDALKEQSIPLAGVVLNQVELPIRAENTSGDTYQILNYYKSLVDCEKHWVKQYDELGLKKLLLIPKRHGPLHTVESLSDIGRPLISLLDETQKA